MLSRRWLLSLLLVAQIALPIPVAAAASITLAVNGRLVAADPSPRIVGGRTLVPVRLLLEELGAAVTWNGETRTVRVVRGATTIDLAIDSDQALVNGANLKLDVPAQIIEGRTFVPLRFLVEAMGMTVGWDETTRRVSVSEPTAAASPQDDGAAADAAAAPAPPRLEPATDPVQIGAGMLWLFAVADDQGTVTVSAESGGQLWAGRLDLARPSQPVQWQVVAGTGDTGGLTIADHWHLFAHGQHWLVFSTAGDRNSFLLSLDRNLQRTGLTVVATNATVTAAESTRTGARPGTPIITNDMFLVNEVDGVAVGHFLPGYGHRIFRFAADGTARGTVDVGGPPPYLHANLSAAVPTDSGFTILATETGDPRMQAGAKAISTDADWRIQGAGPLLSEPGAHVAMPSAVQLPGGYWVIHARVRSVTPTTPISPTAPPAGPALMDDSGSIVRYVLSPRGQIVARTVLQAGSANRPHTALVGNLLVTTWDQTGAAAGVWLQVDRVTP